MRDISFSETRLPSLNELLDLYEDAGWVSYTEDPESLELAYINSMMTITAWYNNDILVGVIRAVGDRHTIVYIQDIIVHSKFQRRGIGTILVKRILDEFNQVRQIILTSDREEATDLFYKSLGFSPMEDVNCKSYIYI